MPRKWRSFEGPAGFCKGDTDRPRQTDPRWRQWTPVLAPGTGRDLHHRCILYERLSIWTLKEHDRLAISSSSSDQPFLQSELHFCTHGPRFANPGAPEDQANVPGQVSRALMMLPGRSLPGRGKGPICLGAIPEIVSHLQPTEAPDMARSANEFIGQAQIWTTSK